MQFARISKALVGVAVLALTSAVAFADVNNKKTTLTVKETIEVPGATLPPGEYVVKLVDSQSNKHIVRFMNKEENEVLSTVIAIPNYRMEATGDTQFEWHETPAGQPPAMKAWFYPGDRFGQEFAYPESRAAELTAATNQQVPHVSDQEMRTAAQHREQDIAQAPAARPQADNTAAERQAAQQTRDRELAAQRDRDAQAQRERELQAQRERERQAQATQTAQNQQRTQNQQRQTNTQLTQDEQRQADPSLTAQQTRQTTSTRNELPETAGLGMLLALIGLGSLGASRVVRKLRK